MFLVVSIDILQHFLSPGLLKVRDLVPTDEPRQCIVDVPRTRLYRWVTLATQAVKSVAWKRIFFAIQREKNTDRVITVSSHAFDSLRYHVECLESRPQRIGIPG